MDNQLLDRRWQEDKVESILITGGAGFIGGNFVRQLAAAGSHRIINLDLLTYAANREALAHLENRDDYVFVEGDICDRPLVSELLTRYQPRAIVHFAAESHVDRSISAPDTFIQTNIVGTHRMLDAALDFWSKLPANAADRFRFVHVSTDEVYGSLGATGKFSETTPYAPNSPYSASKAAADHIARAYFQTYGLPVVTTNCSNNYGPYQFPEKLIPLVTLNALHGKTIPVYGDGSNVRDWIHVEDHCDAVKLVLEKGTPGETYNIGADAEEANIDIVQSICAIVDELRPELPHAPCRSLIEFVADRLGHDHRYAIDSAKIRNELGWQPKRNFEAGLRQTVEWYVQQRPGLSESSPKGLSESPPTSSPESQSHSEVSGNEHEPPKAFVPKTVVAETYVPGDIDGVLIRKLKPRMDARGWLIEIHRDDELPDSLRPAMSYISETNVGHSRGPHEHVEQTDYFAFVGPGEFSVQMWDSRPESPTYGHCAEVRCGESNPVCLVIPPGVVHGYRNVGKVPGWVYNSPNRLYAGQHRAHPVDEIRHEKDDDSPYRFE